MASTITAPLSMTFHANDRTGSFDMVDSFELRAARRALRNIKTLLKAPAMLNLIQPQIDAADVYYKSIITKSNNEWKECRVDLNLTGLTTREIMQWRLQKMSTLEGCSWEEKNRLGMFQISAHPEHYLLPDYDEGVVEVIGEHMARLRIVVTDGVPNFVMAYGQKDYPKKKPTVGQLDDGTVLFYILHEFKETEGGCNIILRLLFPMAAPDVFVSDHAEHLCIEFRNFFERAWEELHGKQRRN